MRARGIDPGATIGWCDIERESAGVFRYVASGTWDAAQIQRGGGIPGLDRAVQVVCVETPEEMHPNQVRAGLAHPGTLVSTIRELISTAKLAERISAEADGMCYRVLEPTAAQCRTALGVKLGAQRGKGDKSTVDQQIGRIIPMIVRDWPKKSNRHVRDAAAAALLAFGPAEVEAAVALALRGQPVGAGPCPSAGCPFGRCTDPAHFGGRS